VAGDVAYLEADIFGGTGTQATVLWRDSGSLMGNGELLITVPRNGTGEISRFKAYGGKHSH